MYIDISKMSLVELQELFKRNAKEDLPCVMENYYEKEGEPFRIVDKKWINSMFIKSEIERRNER